MLIRMRRTLSLATLLFLPALYAAWFRITPATPARTQPAAENEI
mgnify:CR=1 FL=1